MIYHVVVDGNDPPYGTFADLDVAVEKAEATLASRTAWFDVIAVQGTSGMSIGFPAFLALKALGWTGSIVVVRKPGEDTHGTFPIEGAPGARESKLAGKRAIFLDDFVSEGGTRTRVRQAVEEAGGFLVGQYLSRTDSYESL